MLQTSPFKMFAEIGYASGDGTFIVINLLLLIKLFYWLCVIFCYTLLNFDVCESGYASSKSAPKVTLFLNFFLNLLCSLFLFFMLMHYHGKLTLQFEPRLKCKCHNVENKIQKKKKKKNLRFIYNSFISLY